MFRATLLALALVLVSFSQVVLTQEGNEPSLTTRRARRAARWLRRADRSMAAGDRVSALGSYRQAVQIDPSTVRGYAGLAEAYADSGRVDDAFEAIRVGLHRLPGQPELLLWFARLHRRSGDPRGGLAVLRELVRSHPDHVEALIAYLETAQEVAAWTEALRAARRLASLVERGVAVGVEGLEDRLAALTILGRPLDPACRLDTDLGRALCSSQ